jgi:hypothetical protein
LGLFTESPRWASKPGTESLVAEYWRAFASEADVSALVGIPIHYASSRVRSDEPYERNERGGVVFTEAKMETGRPYPFKIQDIWLVAVKHKDDGDVRLYQLV